MEDHSPQEEPTAPEQQAGTPEERRPWVRRTVTLAAAGALTAGAAAVAIPALASDTPSPAPTPSGGYSTDENAPEGPSGRERGNCPDGERPGSGEARGPRLHGYGDGNADRMQPPDRGAPPEQPGTQESATTSAV